MMYASSVLLHSSALTFCCGPSRPLSLNRMHLTTCASGILIRVHAT